MGNATNEQLVDLFRAYLESTELEASASIEVQQTTDLFSLFSELSALKTEIKLESRQVKTAFDQFKEVFATLQSSHEQLKTELERARETQRQLQRSELRPLLLQLLELHDRLESGSQVLKQHHYSRLSWLCKRETSLIDSIKQGQEITLRRLQQLLRQHNVVALATLNQPLDPNTMQVVEIEQRRDIANGIVTEELRKGFCWDEELLRTAEVKVNRQPD